MVFKIAFVSAYFNHFASVIVDANHGTMRASVKLRECNCVADCIRLAVPRPTEGHYVRNQIDAEMVFAGADFVNVRKRCAWLALANSSIWSHCLDRAKSVFRKAKVMLRSLRQLYGKKLGASDGDIGHVRDFYFNDQQWAIRYVVADTGSWLSGRLVLISPHAFGNLHQDGDCLLVNLNRQQIENSPAIESHKPGSLQYEAYWDGGDTSGAGGFPEAPPPPHLMPSKQASDDLHLQSTQALSGYPIQTSEGAIGHVIDFIIDDKS